MDRIAEAEAELRRAQALDASLADPPYTLAVLLWQTNRPAEAADAARTALSRRPDYPEAHFLLGTILRQQGDLESAAREFREAIRHDPRSAEAHLNLGQVLRRLRDPEGASAALAEAERLNQLKVDRQAAVFAVDLGRRKLEKQDLAGAILSFREAVRLAPDLAQAHYELALALRRQGAGDEARAHFEAARRIAPYLAPPAK
jgi:Tfp pilus assembly protein PilF